MEFTFNIIGFDINSLFIQILVQENEERLFDPNHVVNCQPYQLDFNELLHPIHYSLEEFTNVWNRLDNTSYD